MESEHADNICDSIDCASSEISGQMKLVYEKLKEISGRIGSSELGVVGELFLMNQSLSRIASALEILAKEIPNAMEGVCAHLYSVGSSLHEGNVIASKESKRNR